MLKKLWRNIRIWIIQILSKGLENNETSNLNKSDVINSIKEKFTNPGLNCPRCGVLISIDMFTILSQEPIHCPNCSLKLEIDGDKSQGTIEVLKKVVKEEENIEKHKRFKI